MNKNLVYGGCLGVSIIVTLFLAYSGLEMYAIFTGVICLIELVLLVMNLIDSRSEDSLYESELRKILKTYDAVLIDSENLPSLEGKNIIRVSSIENLIDAQVEVRKPVYYKKEFDSCTFVLLDDNEACVYSLKKNDTVVVPIDLIIEENKINKKKLTKEDFLSGIENTTIISLDNNKKYKISPVRDNMEKTIVNDKEFLKMLKAEYMPKLKEK